MILIEENFLSENDIEFILTQWNNYTTQVSNYPVHFHLLDFNKNKINLSSVRDGFFTNKFEKIRLQRYDENLNQVESYHGHKNAHNYVLFLNDGFQGGELEFENGVSVKPKKSTLVYFNNNERHRVLPCIGERWTFVLCSDYYYDLNINYSNTQKSLF